MSSTLLSTRIYKISVPGVDDRPIYMIRLDRFSCKPSPFRICSPKDFSLPAVIVDRYHLAMSLKDNISDNLSLFAEFWRFIRHRKRYWLVPFLIIVVLLSVFIVLTESSAFAPFIYSLF